MAEQACESYGYEMDKELSRIFRDWRKTHNQGVFDAYTPEMRAARKSGVITVFQMHTDVDVLSVTTAA